jgi:hypothetical protein
MGKITPRPSNLSSSIGLNEAERLSFLKNGGVTYVTHTKSHYNWCERNIF